MHDLGSQKTSVLSTVSQVGQRLECEYKSQDRIGKKNSWPQPLVPAGPFAAPASSIFLSMLGGRCLTAKETGAQGGRTTCPRTRSRYEAEPDSMTGNFTWSPCSWVLSPRGFPSHGATLNPLAPISVPVTGPGAAGLWGVAPGGALGGAQLEAGSVHIGWVCDSGRLRAERWLGPQVQRGGSAGHLLSWGACGLSSLLEGFPGIPGCWGQEPWLWWGWWYAWGGLYSGPKSGSPTVTVLCVRKRHFDKPVRHKALKMGVLASDSRRLMFRLCVSLAKWLQFPCL